jgi:hypothetical protein
MAAFARASAILAKTYKIVIQESDPYREYTRDDHTHILHHTCKLAGSVAFDDSNCTTRRYRGPYDCKVRGCVAKHLMTVGLIIIRKAYGTNDA